MPPRTATKSSKTPKETRQKAGTASLVIVESPTKAKTLTQYLGKGYHVMASVGHVKDLPKSKFGIDIEHDFTPQYETIKGKVKVLSGIKAAGKNASAIYLASDPDREGEAIAWHIAEELQSNRAAPIFRVLVSEITKKGVAAAMQAPTQIDMNKVNAQQARRVLDRIVGYKISPLLWEKIRYGLSAGRVQSVAIRLICEREVLIAAFVSLESWSVSVLLETRNQTKDLGEQFWARLVEQGGQPLALSTQQEADTIVSALTPLSYHVSDIEKKERRQKPQPPFITSRLQQDAVRQLHFAPEKTMRIAQQLYEGIETRAEGPVGLITYMRTDSVRVSPDFQQETLAWISATYGETYSPATPNVYKSKKQAQEAHEAIRPTGLSRDPERVREDLTSDQYRLYQLIWNRYIASQMAPAVLDVTRLHITAGDFLLRATGTQVRFKGFTIVYQEGREESLPPDETQGGVLLPYVSTGQTLFACNIEPKQHFTQPPPRYNEALLIHDLEEQGIGRPSTYATILSTLQQRKYVERQEGRFFTTDLGRMVNEMLVAHFPDIVNVAFTAQMEDRLDQIEEGAAEWVETVRDFYGPFSQHLEAARKEMRNMKTDQKPTDIPCKQCGKTMVIKWGRFGKYLACSGYPDCKNTQEFEETGNGIKIVPKDTPTDQVCAECGKPLVIKTSKFGRFLGCSGYPECKHTQPLGTDVVCPETGCDGQIVEKRSRKGKVFYSCSRYPACTFALWDRPLSRACPQCQAPYLVEKAGRGGQVQVCCASRACGYRESSAEAVVTNSASLRP